MLREVIAKEARVIRLLQELQPVVVELVQRDVPRSIQSNSPKATWVMSDLPSAI